MCREGGAGEEEETLHHSRKCACQTRLGLETPPSSDARVCSRIYTKNKSPRTARLSSNPSSVFSVFSAGVFEIFYSSCITLPGDLPIGPTIPALSASPVFDSEPY